MSRIDKSINLPKDYDESILTSYLRTIAYQVNLLSEGVMAAVTNASTTAPSGSAKAYAIGDFVKKKDPVEAGGAGSKYIIIGWVCTTAGSPGTFKECRVLTGN